MECSTDKLDNKLKAFKAYNSLLVYHIIHAPYEIERDCYQIDKYIKNGNELLKEAKTQSRNDMVIQINEELKRLSEFKCKLR